MRKYIDPEVKLIDGTSVKDLGYYVWLKSRVHVIRTKQGEPIKDIDLKYDEEDPYFPLKIKFKLQDNREVTPGSDGFNEFYVGTDLEEYYSYRSKIARMNLQYANFDQYVFEITGSALFRDLLYNINTIAQWARSERFRVSTLDLDLRKEEESFPISSEYKGIKEWEDQFSEYMEYLKKYEKTDDARVKMPYSVSSVYWISINKKMLINLASMVKLKMPFFYEPYIVPMMKDAGLTEGDLKPYVDSYVSIYFNDQSNWKEGSVLNSGFYTINSKMGLIMYSQFLRQGATVCSGFYSELVHDDPEEFKHKVFKGDTILNVTYSAHKDRVKNTVTNRLCAFAMSSGEGPCSWSYFLDNFIPDNMTPDQFRDMLPCKFGKDGLVCDCRFLEDIKFRNSGLENSNDPCPLPSASIELAKKKLRTDKNKIGKLYYDLVMDMNK